MKRTIISVLLLVILGGVLYFGWQKYGQKDNDSQVAPVIAQPQSKVTDLLTSTSNDAVSTGSADVAIDNLAQLAYEGGGEYKPYFAPTVKQALADKKQVILYFFAKRDPTDAALDSDIQKRVDRIPLDTIIVRIDYDSNKELRDSYGVVQQNTLLFLDADGNQVKRISMGITTLAQIVKAMKE